MEWVQIGVTLWFTGLSGAGKTPISQAVEKELRLLDYKKVESLDGDVVRQNLTKGLGFSRVLAATKISGALVLLPAY